MKKYYWIIGLVIAAFGTLKLVNERTFITFLIGWLAYVLFCLGLLKANEIRQIKGFEKRRHV